MTTHQQAKDIFDRAVSNASPRRSLLVRAIGLLESHYGDGWRGAGAGSNNWGAVTAGASWTGATFTHADSLYDPEQGVVEYETQFRSYPSPENGAADLDHILQSSHSRAAIAAEQGDWPRVSRELRESRYYLGTKPKEAAIRDHQTALRRSLDAITAATGEDYAWGSSPRNILALLPATLALGILYLTLRGKRR